MPPKDYVLAFDTSAAHCAVALLCDGEIYVERFVEMPKGQAEHLFGLLADVLSEASITWKDLSAIGVGIGPGNFTGVRISVSAARALSLSLNIPAIGVSRLEALAHGTTGSCLSVLDARRGQFYTQRFFDGVQTSQGALVTDADWNEVKQILSDEPQLAFLPDGMVITPSPHSIAAATALIAHSRSDAPQDRPAPMYLRDADAAPPRDAAPTILP